MRKVHKLAAVISALAAAATMTVPAGALLTVADNPSEYLDSSDETWAFVLPENNNSAAVGLKRMEYVVTFDGDETEYNKERTDGSYDNADAKPFADFEGYIGIGAKLNVNGAEDNWYAFSYKTLTPLGTAGSADIKKLNDTTYLFSCDLDNVEILPTDRDIQLRFDDWANKSDHYRLTVREFYAYTADGTVAIYSDGSGNAEFGTHAALDTSVYSPAPAEEVTTTAAETTTAAPETTAATTTAGETTTNAPAVTTTVKSGTVQQASSTDYGSRDSSLLIVGIVAGVLIIGVIVGIIVYMAKRKSR